MSMELEDIVFILQETTYRFKESESRSIMEGFLFSLSELDYITEDFEEKIKENLSKGPLASCLSNLVVNGFKL